ncbi:dihydropteroate synthase [Saccharibacillus sp. CPCC 101409]|uniref:dihydropteroate synthase n=1 Tax=Saccharibacillus sp. CPCC 101409 TaxID=3058041 RepID=UPI002673E32D|nr:dihydropteroate synthase [Saccharibacillus sp. CPCC 101409]MDO3412882.1 dihydropteroate synthase [Saccharibacillus sp. CPCC 101409]
MKPTLHIRHYAWGDVRFHLGRATRIMGILNTTPDSFSDGGRYVDLEAAVRHAREMVLAGADLIDIGGESTRPGADPVSLDEELSRILPVVERLRRELPDIPLSVDTYKAEVARQSLAAGAHIVNDVWGCKADTRMAQVAAEAGCPVVLTHNRPDTNYTDLLADVAADLMESVQIARAAGVLDENIILDPGIGFAKNGVQNLQLMTQLGRLVELGFPVLLGTSRKRFIRDVLDLPADQVIEGTAATVAFGIAEGCQIVRVHDVAAIKRTVKMCDAMLYAESGRSYEPLS